MGPWTFDIPFLPISFMDISSGTDSMSVVDICVVHRLPAGVRTLQLFQVTFVIFIIYYTVREVKRARKHKGQYLKEPWNFLELTVIGLGYTSIVFYLYRCDHSTLSDLRADSLNPHPAGPSPTPALCWGGGGCSGPSLLSQ